jgi:uncharacterized protein YqeY
VHADLRRALTVAIKERDAVATSALRSALAAIENASAVGAEHAPPRATGPIAGAVSGLGAGEVERRSLSAEDVRALVESEVDQRVAAAAEYEGLGRPDRAERLRAEAAVLAAHLPPARGYVLPTTFLRTT